MRHPLRTKIIVFTLIPILLGYSAFLGYRIIDIRERASDDARHWLLQHAHHQATRLSLNMATLITLAETLRDQFLAPTAQNPALLRTHLMNGLARTPMVFAAGFVSHAPHVQGSLYAQRETTSEVPLPARFAALVDSSGWGVRGAGLEDLVYYSLTLGTADQPLGTLFVATRLDEIHGLLTDPGSHGVQLYVTDVGGHLVLYPRPEFLGKSLFHALALPAAQVRAESVLRLTPRNASTPRQWLALATVPEMPWLIAAVQAEDTALASARAEVCHVTLLAALSLLVVLIITATAVHRITRPLEELDSTVRQIAAGNFTILPTITSDDEIGRVAAAVRQLVQRVSERELERGRVREELEIRVARRTGQLSASNSRLAQQIENTRRAEAALREARDQAQAANRAKSEFLSSMSHELRTPLNGVLGYTQLLRRDSSLNTTHKGYIDGIERSSEHLLNLINQVLDLARIEANKMRIEAHALNLPALLTEVQDLICRAAESKGLEVRLETAADLPPVICTDSMRLRQILLNLLGNAVKFTETGWICLRASRADDLLEFEVEDTGIGLSADAIADVLEPFGQTDSGRAAGGAGLGLSISNRLIRLLGGTGLEVSSQPNQGSRFHFRLPPGDTTHAVVPDDRQAQRKGRLIYTLAPGQQVKVLVVDDQADNRHILWRLLEDAGFVVTAVAGAKEALDHLQDTQFDLVLMDIRMPGMDGIQALARIRADPALVGQCVFAVSASVFGEQHERATAAGFDAFLVKPVAAPLLFERIGEHLGVRFDTRDPGADKPPPAAATLACWPAELAQQTAAGIDEGLAAGDIGQILALAEALDPQQVPATDINTLCQHCRHFDLDGLARFARRLQQAPGA